MESNITEKNHYVPCFWTACWNLAYLDSLRKLDPLIERPRDQEVLYLNLKSDKILRGKTKNVFYEKRAGLAEITKSEALDYCKREFPDQFDELKAYYDQHPESIILDFENHFTGIENSYKPILEKVIINQKLDSIQEKTILSFFIFTQIARNHNNWSDAISVFGSNNMAKFEVFIHFKHSLANPVILLDLLSPFIYSQWKLHRSSAPIFPISDNPVSISSFHVYIPIAPDLLLEIDLNRNISEEEICSVHDGFSFTQYEEFQKRTIENSTREIVFSSKSLLEKWQNTETYRRHLENNFSI